MDDGGDDDETGRANGCADDTRGDEHDDSRTDYESGDELMRARVHWVGTTSYLYCCYYYYSSHCYCYYCCFGTKVLQFLLWFRGPGVTGKAVSTWM